MQTALVHNFAQKRFNFICFAGKLEKMPKIWAPHRIDARKRTLKSGRTS